MNKLLFVVSFFGSLNAITYQYNVKMQFKNSIKMDFETGASLDRSHTSIVVNGKSMMCDCGRRPVYLIFYYGYPRAFCYKHLPVKEEMPQIEFGSLLSTAEGNENGAKG